jgi:formate dehydrogenase assembly factor FdhD
MISKTTPEFWQHYERLPKEIRRLADKCYDLWQENSAHSSVRFKLINAKQRLYSARVGIHYRALAYRDGDVVIWVWIGHHSEYDKLIG